MSYVDKAIARDREDWAAPQSPRGVQVWTAICAIAWAACCAVMLGATALDTVLTLAGH